MVKPWGEIGAWAEEAERADEEAKELAEAAAAAAGREEGFPILGELVVTTSVGKQQQHGKKKKAQKTISLSELLVGKNVGPGGAGKGRQASDSRGSEEERQHGGRAGSWGAGKKFVSGEREGTDLVHKSGGMPQVDESRPVERPRLILLPRSQIVDASVPSAIPSKETPVGKGSEILESDPSMPDIQLPKPKPRSNPFGAARPREEILAEKGQDWRKFEAELENREREIRNSLPSTPDGAPQRWTRLPLKYEPHGQGRENSRPSSSHSSRPQTPDLSAQLGTKSRAKVNPFGDAKPREILLEEKGKDWRRIDFELEHRSVERLDTEEETKLKKEIKALEELLNNNIESRNEKIMYGVLNEKAEKEGGMKLNVKEELIHKEKELEDLTRALDDKIRYSQRSVDRPPSRGGHSDSGRTSEPSRPSSRAGRSDFGRGIEPANFPKGIDIWIRPTAGSDLNRPLTYRDRDRRTFERW
ncbi:hypothetical protein O6H91_08G105200 [Diphasiastrum complanatum]|uniref:Uncharacterized protein n=1 Tax=Diphasiastrum complanatum TaxID=34168 RepID=A0ACC2D0G9_DIPCM|nr:hypothetical protein O6H91_08G105200 [Diphasiastrum complanatum]